MQQIRLLAQAQTANLSASPKTLKFHHLLLIIVLAFNLSIATALVLARRSGLNDPFAAFANHLPGQPVSGIDTQLFSCSGPLNPAASLHYCKLEQAEGTFTRIHMTTWGAAIRQVNFTLRENILRVGDLLALWGQPDLQKHSLRLYLFWRDQNAIVTADGQFSPFLPVQRVQFINADLWPVLPGDF